MPTARPPAPRRPRPHPARRARKIAGTVSVTSMLVLTGCMAATTKIATGKAASTPTVATPATTATSATTATTTPTTSGWTSRSFGAAAGAGNSSSQSDTSTNGS